MAGWECLGVRVLRAAYRHGNARGSLGSAPMVLPAPNERVAEHRPSGRCAHGVRQPIVLSTTQGQWPMCAARRTDRTDTT